MTKRTFFMTVLLTMLTAIVVVLTPQAVFAGAENFEDSFFKAHSPETLTWEMITNNTVKIGFRTRTQKNHMDLPQEEFIEINTFDNGRTYPLKILNQQYYTPQGVPQKFVQTLFYKNNFYTSQVTIRSNRMILQRSHYKNGFHRSLPIPSSIYWSTPEGLFANNLGQNLKYTVFSMDAPDLLNTIQAGYITQEECTIDGKTVSLYKYLIHEKGLMDFSYYAWVNTAGQFVKTEDMITGIATEIISKEHLAGQSTGISLKGLFELVPTQPLANDHDLKNISYQIHMEDPALRSFLIENPLQEITSSQENDVILHRKQESGYNYHYKLPVQDAQAWIFPEPRQYFREMPHEDARTTKLIIGNTQDVLLAATQLSKWVYSVTSDDSLALMPVICIPQAYCNTTRVEKTLILGNRALSAGIPLRIASGLKYVTHEKGSGVFIPHIWLETYVEKDKWVGIDPDNSKVFVNPSYILLGEKDLKVSYDVFSPLSSIFRFLSLSTIDVLTFSSTKFDSIHLGTGVVETGEELQTRSSSSLSKGVEHVNLSLHQNGDNIQNLFLSSSSTLLGTAAPALMNDDFLAGVKYLEEGNTLQAMKSFHLVSENIPFDNDSMRYELAVKLSEFMLYSLAETELQKIKANPLSNHYFQEKGDLLRKLTFGEVSFDAEHETDTVTAYSLITFSSAFDDAKILLDTVLSRDSRYYPAYYTLGLWYQKQYMLDEAIGCFEKVLAADPYFMRAYFALYDTYGLNEDMDNAVKILHKAQMLLAHAPYNHSHYYEDIGNLLAFAKAKKSLLANAKNVTAHITLANVYLKTHNTELAELTATRLTHVNPQSSEGYALLCQIQIQSSKLKAAEENCKKAVALQPYHARAKKLLGDIEQKKYNDTQAEALYNASITLNRKYVESYFALIDLYIKKQQYTKATNVIHRAVAYFPDHVGFRYRTALINAKTDKVALAINQLESVVHQNPENSVILSLLASLHLQENHLNQAQHCALQALAVNNQDQNANYVLGQIDEKNNLLQAAYHHYLMAYRLDSGRKELFDTLTRLHDQLYKGKKPDFQPPQYDPSPQEFQRTVAFLRSTAQYLKIKLNFIKKAVQTLAVQGGEDLDDQIIETINLENDHLKELAAFYRGIYKSRVTPQVDLLYNILLNNTYNEVTLTKEALEKLETTDKKNAQEFLAWFYKSNEEVGAGVKLLEDGINAFLSGWKSLRVEEAKGISGYDINRYYAEIMAVAGGLSQ